VAEVGVVEQTPAQEGRNMTMVLGPVRREKPPKTHKEQEHPKETTGAPTAVAVTEADPEVRVQVGEPGTDAATSEEE